MFPVFLLAAAVGVIAVALLFLFWRNVDRRVQLAYGDDSIEELTQRLEQALAQQRRLTDRVEHLEAIVASEPWDVAHAPEAPPLALPDDQADVASEEQARRRQRSR